MKRIAAALATAALFAVPAADAHAAKSCGSLRASGPWGNVRVTVHVQKGHVACGEARRAARILFTGRGRYHNGGYGYNSWWIVRGGWVGDGNTGGWALINRGRHARIGGSY